MKVLGIATILLIGLFCTGYILLGMTDLFPERKNYPMSVINQTDFTLHPMGFLEHKPNSTDFIQSQKCTDTTQQILDQKYSNFNEIERSGKPPCTQYTLGEDESIVDYQPKYDSSKHTLIPSDGSWNFLTHPENCSVLKVVVLFQNANQKQVIKSFNCYPGWDYSNLSVTKKGRIYLDYGGHGYTWNWIPGTKSFYLDKK